MTNWLVLSSLSGDICTENVTGFHCEKFSLDYKLCRTDGTY